MFSYILLSKLNVFLILFFCSCTITPIVCWLWEINGFWIRRLRKGLGCPPLTGFVHSSSDIPEKSLFAQFLHLWFWSLFAQFLHLWSCPPLDPGVEVYTSCHAYRFFETLNLGLKIQKIAQKSKFRYFLWKIVIPSKSYCTNFCFWFKIK